MTTTLRLPNGRYQVTLPIRNHQIVLGNSRHTARRNEKNLLKKPELKLEYDVALQEYIDFGHMKLIIYKPNIYI